jgi:hypothetical protein
MARCAASRPDRSSPRARPPPGSWQWGTSRQDQDERSPSSIHSHARLRGVTAPMASALDCGCVQPQGLGVLGRLLGQQRKRDGRGAAPVPCLAIGVDLHHRREAAGQQGGTRDGSHSSPMTALLALRAAGRFRRPREPQLPNTSYPNGRCWPLALSWRAGSPFGTGSSAAARRCWWS